MYLPVFVLFAIETEKRLPNLPLAVNNEVIIKENAKESLKTRLKDEECKVQASPSVEHSKDLHEKNVLKHMIDSALSYLQRSVAIMIKSSMSRLYGTKETLEKLHKIASELHRLPKNSKQSVALKRQSKSIIDESCKFWEEFWEDDHSPDEDWVWRCRRILPRDGDPQEKWKDVTDNLTSWKIDIGLKLIKRAKYQSCVHCRLAGCTYDSKCKCAKQNGVALFNSKYVQFKTKGSKNYNFVTLAEKASNVRNFYAHVPTYKDIIEHIAEHFEIIEQFSTELLQWIKCEDGNLQYITYCQEDLLNIKSRQNGYCANHIAKWDNVLDGLKNLNFNDFGYILVSTPCTKNAGVAVTVEELAYLSSIPWAAIVDFDISSGEDGLLHSLCELEEGGLYRLKVSCQSSSKNMVVPFPYVDIDGAEKGELCRDGHIPWIFPHGQIQNQTNKACPFNDYERYYVEVHKPLIDATAIIAKSLNQKNSLGVVSVVLCYGSYACESEKLPYKNYLSDLRHLCNDLKVAGGHVVVLSDSLSLVEFMKPLPVLLFPLDIFCKMVQDKLAFGQNKLPPVNMPSSVGLRPITFDEEDFELVHEHIDKHELFRFEAQRKIELQQQDDVEDEEQLSLEFGSIQDELRIRFYKGQKVTWISLNADHAITRREEKDITVKLRKMLQDRVRDKVEPARFVMYHSVGAGATTLAKKILWNLRTEFPCVILKSNYKGTESKVKCTSDALQCLYEDLQCPVLLLIDEEPSFKTIPRLTSSVQAKGIPVVFFQVQRYDSSDLVEGSVIQDVSGLKDTYSLPNTLDKGDADNLMLKFYSAFGSKRISADHCVAKTESSLVTPKEKDHVTDFEKSGIISEVKHVREALVSYYLVKVTWEDNTKEMWCSIGSSDNKYKMVYLKTEIKTETNRLYQTFHFYGIMYLDEDFRKPMYEHIKSCLSRMHPRDQGQDVKLLVLAYLSILFTFKVCESIHIKAFKHLCHAVTKTNKTVLYKLEKFIPEAAKEFVIITREGQFRITHPIVAHEIIKYYSSISSNPVTFPASFIRDFLKYMLEEHNEDATLAVNRLLRYREYTSSDGSGYPTKKPFSELILALDSQNPQDVVSVLEYASELISNCHAYGHYARYLSKKMQQYDKALIVLKDAENLTSQCFEEGIVLNIKGDIYRERLDQYLKHPENLDWNDSSNNMAYELHFSACEAYQESYNKHHDDFPLFNELVVRMNLLEAIKKSLKLNERRFLEYVHCIPDTEVSKSIDTCMQLVKDLKEYWAKPFAREENRDLITCSEEARVKTLEIRLLDIIGSSKEKQKSIMHDLMTMTKYQGANVNLPSIRRSYIHLCRLSSNPSPPDLDTCLYALEKNFEVIGHVDKDMKNWLLVVRNLPDIGGNLETIEKKLISWKENGPSLIVDKRNIRATNDPIWANFYLTICYFIQLTETSKVKVPLIVNKYTEACNLLKQKSKTSKSRFRITEWLHCHGTGFGRLKSGQPIHNEMMRIAGGSVGSLSWQQSKGDQGYPYISWKGLRIFFDAKRYSTYRFKQGHPVDFGIGFTLRGPQAIILESVSSKPSASSGHKVVKAEDGTPQLSETLDIVTPKPTYSQAAQSVKAPMKQQKADQHVGEPVKHQKKRKHRKRKN